MTAQPEQRQGGDLIPFRQRPADHDDLELASPHQPARQDDTSEVLDAELVEPTPPAPKTAVGRAVAPIRVVATRVTSHQPTVRTSKAVARHAVYVASGAGVLAKRWWDRRTKYERYERSAEAAGDREEMKHWEQRGEHAKEQRHRRRQELLTLPWRLAKAVAIAVPIGVVLLVLVGLAVAINASDLGLVFAPLVATVQGIGWLAAAGIWLVSVLAVLAPGLVVGVLWWVGRGANAAPGWLRAPASKDQAGALVTADAIVRALQKLGLAKLDKAFKDGWILPFELPPHREGTGQFKGYRAIFGLPEGVTPTMVMDKVDVLAANLNRTSMETWPSDYGQEKGGRARHVNLYVADRGVMEKPTPTYPLMHEGAADVFQGVPIGITQRGDGVLMPINGSNTVVGGQPGQGKSNAMRVVFAGAALDPLAELRVHVFAGNGDFDAYEPRLSRYQKGASTEHAASATAHLEELLAEVERREERLAEIGAKKLTRSIAQQHADMRPIIVGFSECHELFGDKEHGELAAELAIRVVKRGRKTGVSMLFDTQSSRATAIPSQLVENVGANCCFCVKTWRNNDGFLGDGSFAAGIRATELRFNVDRGTMLATGLTEELFEIVRTYFIEVNDDTGWDAATQIIERAMEQIHPQTSTDRKQLTVAVVERDLLADVAAVIGKQTVPAADIPALLARNFGDWPLYRTLNGIKLRERLKDEYGVRVPSTDNRWPVSPKLIADALARRNDEATSA